MSKIKNFKSKNKNINKSIKDFWKWAYSDLIQNTTRGVLAEYIVAMAAGIDRGIRDPWQSYDLKSKSGQKIEVKNAGYVQAWGHAKKVRPTFSIGPSKVFTKKGLVGVRKYHSNIYVLCYHFEEVRKKADPLNLDQWKFWVFTEREILKILDGHKSITIRKLIKKVGDGISFEKLKKSKILR